MESAFASVDLKQRCLSCLTGKKLKQERESSTCWVKACEIKTDNWVSLTDWKVPGNDPSSWMRSDLETESGLSWVKIQNNVVSFFFLPSLSPSLPFQNPWLLFFPLGRTVCCSDWRDAGTWLIISVTEGPITLISEAASIANLTDYITLTDLLLCHNCLAQRNEQQAVGW